MKEDKHWVKKLTSQQLCYRLRKTGKPTLQKIADIFEEQELDGEDMTTIIYEELCEVLPKLGMRKKLQKFMAQMGVQLPDQSEVAEEGNVYFEERPKKKNVPKETYFEERPKKKRKLLTRPPKSYSSPVRRKLCIRAVPRHKNNIADMNAFFSKWGTLSNLEVLPDQHQALLQYSTFEEANRCFQDCRERAVMGDPRIEVEFSTNSWSAAERDAIGSSKGKNRQAAAKPSRGNNYSKPSALGRKSRLSRVGQDSDSRWELYQLAEKHNITMEATDRIIRTAEILRRSVWLEGLPRCRSKVGLEALKSDLENRLRNRCGLSSNYFQIEVRQENSTGRILLSYEKAESIYEVVKALDGSTLEPKFVISAIKDNDLARFLTRSSERDFFIKVRPILENNFYPTLSDIPPRSRRPSRWDEGKPTQQPSPGSDSDMGLVKDREHSEGLEDRRTEIEALAKGKHVRISGGEFDGYFGVILEAARKKGRWLVKIEEIGQLTLHEKRLSLVAMVDRNPPPPGPSISTHSDSTYDPINGGWAQKERLMSAPLQNMNNQQLPPPSQVFGAARGFPIFRGRGSGHRVPFGRGRGFPLRARGRGLPSGPFPTFARGRVFHPPAQGRIFPPPSRGRIFPPPGGGRIFPPPGRGRVFHPPARGRGFPPPARVSGFLPPARGRGLPSHARGRGFPSPFFRGRGRGVNHHPRRGRGVGRVFPWN